MTTERPSGEPPASEPEPEASAGRTSDTGRPADTGRSSDLDLVRQTLPAMAPARSQRPGTMRLASGRSVAVVEVGGEERVEIRAATGEMLVAVRLTDQGPVFSLSGASLEVTAAKSLSLAAESIKIAATKHLSLEAGELHRVKARDIEIEAAPGAVSIRANDDVDIVGERVRLNSDDPPMPQSWDEFRARRAPEGHPFSEDMPLSPPRRRSSVALEPSPSPATTERSGTERDPPSLIDSTDGLGGD